MVKPIVAFLIESPPILEILKANLNFVKYQSVWILKLTRAKLLPSCSEF